MELVLKDKFSEVFEAKPEKIKNVKEDLELAPGASPVFFKASPVLYAVKEGIEMELNELIKQEILRPVQHRLRSAGFSNSPCDEETRQV